MIDRLHEVLTDSTQLDWRQKSIPGLYEKMLWRDESTGASIALIRFSKGVGIPDRHSHASNQFMYCLSGAYSYTNSGVLLKPGSFYWNEKGNVHGPTTALEETVFLEIYDGPHYPQRPSFYKSDEDAH
ncbi:MAG: cupin domain-containing protein [Bacilli bacterium]